MKVKSITLFTLITVLALVFFTGCDETSSVDKIEREATAAAQKEAQSQIGMPAIKNWQEKKLAKWIYELRDRADLVCYAYIKNEMTGQLHFFGKCVGYGLPYSVQFTNPMKPGNPNWRDTYVIPQADPNGLYMPDGLSATFVIMVDSEGEPWPVYIESELTVSPFPLPYAVYPKGFKK